MSAFLVKYLLEGLAIGVVLFLTSKGKLSLSALATIILTVAFGFYILDLSSPRVARGARLGTGFGLGLKQIGGSDDDEDETETTCGDMGDLSEVNLRPEILRELNLMPTPNQTSACSMQPYLTDAQRASDYARVLENESRHSVFPDSDPNLMKQSNEAKCYHMPYKVIPGQWAEQDLIAGYNESVTAANTPTAYWSGFSGTS